MNETVEQYRRALQQVRAGVLHLENRDFDTGRRTVAGEYPLTDGTYADLVHRLAEHQFKGLTPELREDILAFFANPNAPMRRDPKKWQRTQEELQQLRAATASAKTASATSSTSL